MTKSTDVQVTISIMPVEYDTIQLLVSIPDSNHAVGAAGMLVDILRSTGAIYKNGQRVPGEIAIRLSYPASFVSSTDD